MTIKIINQDENRYEYYIRPSVIVLDKKLTDKYFGMKGAGSIAFLREQGHNIPVEVHEYDKFEGVFTRRIDKGVIK